MAWSFGVREKSRQPSPPGSCAEGFGVAAPAHSSPFESLVGSWEATSCPGRRSSTICPGQGGAQEALVPQKCPWGTRVAHPPPVSGTRVLTPILPPVQGSRPGKNVQLTENEIRGLCLKSREIFLSQPILLELEAPLKICGETPAQAPLFPEGGTDPPNPWILLILSPTLALGSSLDPVPVLIWFPGSQVTSMASTTTSCGCLNTGASLQRATTSSWGTM